MSQLPMATQALTDGAPEDVPVPFSPSPADPPVCPSVCLSPNRSPLPQIRCLLSDPSLCPSLSPGYTALHLASKHGHPQCVSKLLQVPGLGARCCAGGRVLCQRGVLSVLELPSLLTGAGWHGGSRLCPVLCRAAQHLLGPLACQGATSTAAVCLSVPCPSVTQALSLRPPALWMWLTAEAKQRCTMQVSGDSASPVLLLSPPEAERSASVLLPSGQRLHLVLGDPL